MKRAILIGGGSCSGKTSFARYLAGTLPRAVLLATDDYYLDRSTLTRAEIVAYNFDRPDAIDSDGLSDDVRSLLAGRAVPRRVYDFSQHKSGIDGERTADFDFLVIEGLFALKFAPLREQAFARFFVAASDAARLERRVERDVAERGRNADDVRRQFADQVRPMHEAYVEPTRTYADYVISNEGSGRIMHFRAAASWLADKLGR
ncbi:MAG: uridine kinase [Victivallaceae bacterium]|nr:hypothetical protein [Victivallaceae bacterium]